MLVGNILEALDALFPLFLASQGGADVGFCWRVGEFFFSLGNTKWYYCPVLPPAAYHGDWGWGDGPAADGMGKGTWRQAGHFWPPSV